MGFRYLYLVYLMCTYELIFAQDNPIVDTNYGSVSGKTFVLEDESVVDTFMGVPYAKPPVGELRFELPQEPDSWTEIYDASEPRESCVQGIENRTFASSEDCLHLNIYSPQREDPEELLPVMVFIHGGGYQTGLNNIYPGYIIARKQVVMVAANYRLGILGFAYTGDGVISGNMGLMDQVQALIFVQENIAAFGGDPNQVTVFGESAGSSSVSQLMFIPFAEGLFHSAIMQSGCEYSTFSTTLPEWEPEKYIVSAAEQFNCPVTPSDVMVQCLREVDAQELINTVVPAKPGYDGNDGSFSPVIDGVIIPDIYENLRESGEYIHVTEMIGLNEKEGNSFLYFFLPELEIPKYGLNRSDFNEILWNRAINKADAWPNTTKPEDVYEAFKFFYADWPYYDDQESNRQMLGQIITDEWFGYTSDLHAKLSSDDGNQVYFYVYDYVPDGMYIFPEWVGAYHGIEVDIILGWPFLKMPENTLAFEHSQNLGNRSFTEKDVIYSDFMMNIWTNFAKYGNPTPEGTVGPNGTLFYWPQFNSTELNYMNFKPEPASKKDYRQDAFAFWREYLPYLIYDEPITGEFLYGKQKQLGSFHGLKHSDLLRV